MCMKALMNMLDISANADVYKDCRYLTFHYCESRYCSACAIAFIPTEISILLYLTVGRLRPG